MTAMRRVCAAVAAVGLATGLAGCDEAAGVLPTETVTVTASTSTSTPASPVSTGPAPSSSATAEPVSTPLPDDRGCSPTTSSLDIGFSAKTVDIDGDGRADTEFYTKERPLRFGVRTASGATITIADDLPGGVHHGLIGTTEQGRRALIDDGTTAEVFTFADCRFTQALDQDGAPFRVTLRRPGDSGGTAPTGLLCTNLNGGEFVAEARAAKQADGRWNVWWGILQDVGNGRFRADPLTGDPVFTNLSFDDERVGNAFTSSCNDAPVVYWPDA